MNKQCSKCKKVKPDIDFYFRAEDNLRKSNKEEVYYC